MANGDQILVPAAGLGRHDEVIFEPVMQVARKLQHLVQPRNQNSDCKYSRTWNRFQGRLASELPGL